LSKKPKWNRKYLSLHRREIVDAQKWYWFDQIDWYPHRGQMAAHQAVARDRYTTSGRRGGKTAWVSKEASAYAVAGPFRIWFAGPNYDLVMMEWNNFIKSLEHPANPHRFIHKFSSPLGGNIYMDMSNGASAKGVSLAQPEKNPKVGEEVDLLVLCEGARINGLGGEGGIWEDQLAGNLDSRLGDMVCPTTPKGKDNWLCPRFELAAAGKDPDGWALRWPAWENVEGFLESPIRKWHKLSRRAFMQEVLGMFVSWAGAIWIEDCGFDPDIHVIPRMADVPNWWNRVEIIDTGWSDYAVWIAAVMDEGGVLHIVDEYKCKFTMYRDFAAEIIRRRKIMYPEGIPQHIPVYVDPEEPRAREEMLIQSRLVDPQNLITCLPANNDVMAGFEAGATRLKTGLMKVTKNCEYIIDSLTNHEWSENVKSNGDKVQKRDAGIHGSDVARYLQLAPLRASKRPQVITPGQFGMADLLKLDDRASLLGMTLEEWRRHHAA
jgi:hypothetical protein